ncbi:MAG: SGNH/GDSL hydrolase family protein, partial [Bacteroidales bacterium]|nr:SGNH/GDSL hydrolase family protein [Bacteroidales bacterium]
MNRSKFFSTVAALLFAIAGSFAQEKETVFVDASVFPLYGKCIENTSGRYERLPLAYKDISRESLWSLGRNSAGLYVRFRSNSTAVTARWKPKQHHMSHMTDVGDNGLDLYILTEKDGWRFAGSGFLWKDAEVRTKKLVKDMDPVMREYMLYLPLYTNLESLELGFDEGSVFDGPAVQSPKSGSPIVMYGSSILQGGCANRPGMAFTAIIGRRLDREVINLGFSGNAKLDYEIAELMTQVENP